MDNLRDVPADQRGVIPDIKNRKSQSRGGREHSWRISLYIDRVEPVLNYIYLQDVCIVNPLEVNSEITTSLVMKCLTKIKTDTWNVALFED